jgi:hypothetical protein
VIRGTSASARGVLADDGDGPDAYPKAPELDTDPPQIPDY